MNIDENIHKIDRSKNEPRSAPRTFATSFGATTWPQVAVGWRWVFEWFSDAPGGFSNDCWLVFFWGFHWNLNPTKAAVRLLTHTKLAAVCFSFSQDSSASLQEPAKAKKQKVLFLSGALVAQRFVVFTSYFHGITALKGSIAIKGE